MSNTKVALISLATLALAGTAESLAEVSTRVATQANAERITTLAGKRIAAAAASIAEDKALVAYVTSIKDSLAVGTASGAKVIPVDVGDSIIFKRKSKDGAVEVAGVVKAVRPAEEGKLPQYRVEVGEGFDAELVNVFPGTVTKNVTKAGAADVAPEVEDDGLGEPAADVASEGVVTGGNATDDELNALLG